MKHYSEVRHQVERSFENLGNFLYKYSSVCGILIIILTTYLAVQIPQLKIESSVEDYLQSDDQTLVAYKDFQNQFGSGSNVIIGVKTPSLFSNATLTRLLNFQKDLEVQIPHISQVKGLTNAPYIRSEQGSLLFGSTSDLLTDKEGVAGFKKFILSSSLYINRYLSANQDMAIISLSLVCPTTQSSSLDVLSGLMTEDHELLKRSAKQLCSLSSEENSEMIAALKLVQKQYQRDDFQIYLTGLPVLRQFTGSVMKKDVSKFLLLSVLIIAILLSLLFKNLPGLLYPMIVVFCSLSSTVGSMVLLNIPFQPPTKILPSFLITVGIGASVHIMFIFYQFLSQECDKKHAIAKTLGHSGMPIVLTSLTTAAGLLSFSTAEVIPIANLGIIAALGVFISLLYSLLLLPILLSIFPVKKRNSPFFIRHVTMVSVAADKIVRISTGYPKTIVFSCLAILIFSSVGISRLSIVYNPLLRLPEQAQLRIDTEKIAEQFPGIATVELLVKTKHPGDLTNPEIVQKFEEFFRQIAQYSTGDIFVFNVFSIFDVIKEIHKNLMPAIGPKTVLPDNAALIEQELLLLESSSPDFITHLTDTNFQLSRIVVQAPWTDAVAYTPFLKGIETLFNDVFKENATITVTGVIPLFSRIIYATIESMIKSYLIAIIVISGAIVLFLGHFRLGLLSMFPNILPIIITLGYMGWTGIPLDMYTLLIGSIALGLVVDDTIHFMFNFRRYYEKTSNVADAVKMTLEGSGLAMLATTIVLACGSFILMASEMRNLYHFGMLTGMTLITALLADFFLIPALMSLYYKPKEH